MKSYTLRYSWFLVLTAVVLLSCLGGRDQQFIAYTSDFQAWVMDTDGAQNRAAVETGFATSGLKWSPDRKRMLFTAITAPDRTSIWIANSDGSEPHQVSGEFGSIRAVWLNDDILITHVITEEKESGDLDFANYTLDLRSGAMPLYSQGPESIVPLSSGDRWLALNRLEYGLILYDLEGNIWTLFPTFVLDPHAFDVSPSGREVALCNDRVVNAESTPNGLYKAILEANGATDPSLVYQMEGCRFVRWSPNGEYVALLDNQSNFHVLDTATFSLLRVFDIGPLTESAFIWSPDNKFVIVSRHYGQPGPGPKEIARVSIEDGEIVRLTENESVELITDWVSLPLR